ncbi:hypothetical protein B4U78_016095 [Microbacterium esteraromaticum]|nr:hypothetical protein B4U78_016095 [Microbacterium esteraromaticum]
MFLMQKKWAEDMKSHIHQKMGMIESRYELYLTVINLKTVPLLAIEGIQWRAMILKLKRERERQFTK